MSVLGKAPFAVADASSRKTLERDPLKVTTNDDEHGQEEDHDEDQQPDYHKEGSVGSSLRRSAGSFASPPSVSSTAGRPTFIHGAASDLLLRAAQLVVSPQLLLEEELVVSFPGPPVFIHRVADKPHSRKFRGSDSGLRN